MARDRIPFHLPELKGGIVEAKGVMYLEDEFLVFEVESAVFGEFDKKKKLIKIEPRALEDVHYERRLIVDRLYIEPKEGELLEAMPGDFLSEVVLKIWVNHRSDAEALVSELLLQMT